MFPTYDDVPAVWKHPFGPYRKAPDRCGGKWWFVNPFTGPEPWARECPDFVDPKAENLPLGFVEIFGPRPDSNDFHGEKNPSMAFRVATMQWEQELAQFKQAGRPINGLPDYPELAENFPLAESVAVAWGMGAPRYYEGRYGWTVRFPDAKIPGYQANVHTFLTATHLVIANYQVRLLQEGVVPDERHPFVPPRLFPDGEEIDPGTGTAPLPDHPNPKPPHAKAKAKGKK